MLFKGILFLLFLISCNNEEPTANSGQNIQAYYNTPHGIVVNDNTQTVYLSDRGNGYLYKYSSSGSLLGSLLIDSQNNFVSGINISSDKIYACNQQSSSVSIIEESSFTLEKKVEIVTSGSSCYLDATTPEDCSLYQDEGCFWMEMPDDSQISSHCMPPSSPVESECSQYGTSQACEESSSIGCMWMNDQCMLHNSEAPHYIVVDEEAGYWFVTSIMTGYVLQYSIENNNLIGKIKVGDQPALMAINTETKKLYVSRMMQMSMPAMDMGSSSNDIQTIGYSDSGLSFIEKFSILAPNPHAIDFDGENIYTVSNSSDQIIKINSDTGETSYAPITLSDGITGGQDDPSIETFVLKPIACKYIGENLLVVTCQGGPFTAGNLNNFAPSQVQLWNTKTMEFLDRYEFSSSSSAWHIDVMESQNKLFVALSGSGGQGGGIVCLEYDSQGITQIPIWEKISSDF